MVEMRRSHLSVLTAAISLAGALIWLATGNAAVGILWAVISFGWLLASVIHWRRPEIVEPSPGQYLVRRFSRLIRLWS